MEAMGMIAPLKRIAALAVYVKAGAPVMRNFSRSR